MPSTKMISPLPSPCYVTKGRLKNDFQTAPFHLLKPYSLGRRRTETMNPPQMTINATSIIIMAEVLIIRLLHVRVHVRL